MRFGNPRFALMLAAGICYPLVVGVVMLQRGIVATPDLLLVALVPLAIFTGKFVAWLSDWVPFIGLLLGWEAMRSVAFKLSPSIVHFGSLRPELALFHGSLPELWLQQLLDQGRFGLVLDKVAAGVDLMHFPAVLGIAFVVWLHGRRSFLTYSLALFATAFVAFVVFLLLPTAPPWYAAERGLIPGLQHVMTQVMPVSWSGYYQSLDPNPVAADPSLHAAFPFVGFLALLRLRSPLAWPLLAWCIAVWFSVVYLGEHYLLDLLTGVGLATLCWKAATLLLDGQLRAFGNELVVRGGAAHGHGEVEPVHVQGQAQVGRGEA